MIRSMTGFARAERQDDFGSLIFEVKSVNHRYLEIGLRLPEEFRALEPKVRVLVGRHVARGKVDIGLRFAASKDAAGDFELSPALLKRLSAAAGNVAAAWDGETAPVSVMDVLRWPGLVSEPERDYEAIHTAALALLDEVLGELVTSRGREGERLAEMLETRCAAVEEQVAFVRARLPEVSATLLARLRERVQSLDIEADEGRLETEIALVAQKADVAEELDRLESHVSEARAALTSGEPVGRRLDFLMQEFNREANTLASKSQDTSCSRAAVELKVIIEQMREQVQNVE